MKKLIKKSLLIACAAFSPLLSIAQADIHFSQFYETSMLRNPALTGIFKNDYKFGAFYRNQWSSISHPYVTAVGYAEVRLSVGKMSDDYVSFGLLGYVDKAGSVNQSITSFYPAINYSKSVSPGSNGYLSFGLTGGYTQYSFDPSKATFNNQFQFGQYDPNNPSLENIPMNKMTMWDIGGGINYNTNGGRANNVTYVVGLAAYHLTQPQFSYFPTKGGVNQNMRWNGNAAFGVDVTPSIEAQVHLNYALQGSYSEKIGGLLLSWTQTEVTSKPLYTLTAGVLYRYNDAVVPVIKVKYRNSGIGISYDVNVSTLKEASNLRGGYEVTLFLAGDFYDKSGILRKTVCPKF